MEQKQDPSKISKAEIQKEIRALRELKLRIERLEASLLPPETDPLDQLLS